MNEIVDQEEVLTGNIIVPDDDDGDDEEEEVAVATRKPPMSAIDQLRLRKIFIDKKAENWNRQEKKKIDAIIQDELFKHLNKQQVVRRYNLYSAEKFLRKKYGTKFFKRTFGGNARIERKM